MKKSVSIIVGLLLLVTISQLQAAPSSPYEPVSVQRRSEPSFPHWAEQKGISYGFARIAFYVDEDGNASEFLPTEYTHEAFADQLIRSVRKWKLRPAYRYGKPIKSICHAYWEFYPNRPIRKDTFAQLTNRFGEASATNYRALEFAREGDLDASLQMVEFPSVAVPSGYDVSQIEDGKIMVRCSFYVNPQGLVVLPLIKESTAPELNDQVLRSLRSARFDIPTQESQPKLVFAEKTYLVRI